MKILICENIRSLHNIGAFFRTVDALGVDEIFLCGACGTPPRKEITKTALGAEDLISWKYFEDILQAISEAKSFGCCILGLELTNNSKNLCSFSPPSNWALIVGHEITGVSQEALNQSDVILEIPMKGKKQSLNVSVAAGIAMYVLTSFK